MSSSESEGSTVQVVKTKSTKGRKTTRTKHGKNEGQDPNWAFQPPTGSKLLDHSADHVEFDWDALKDDEDTELWVIRVPENVKMKVLEDFVVDSLPSRSSHTTKIASHTRKNRTYELYNLGNDGEEEESSVGGEELRRLTCLLPRKGKKGRLFRTPKPISRRLVMQIAPHTAEDTLPHDAIPRQNAPRQAYPPELLTHRFMPYGSLAPEEDTDEMVVEELEERGTSVAVEATPNSHKKAKKRKGGDDEVITPQKTKKVKKHVT